MRPLELGVTEPLVQAAQFAALAPLVHASGKLKGARNVKFIHKGVIHVVPNELRLDHIHVKSSIMTNNVRLKIVTRLEKVKNVFQGYTFVVNHLLRDPVNLSTSHWHSSGIFD